MEILLLQYVILSIVVGLSSVRISYCIDILDKQTKIGGALVGGIILAGVTSLPELITSLSSTIVLDNPDLALGNILGSNAFNLFILAVGNLVFINYRLFNHTGKSNIKTNMIGTIVYFIVLISFCSLTTGRIGHVGVSSIFIVILYYINLTFMADDKGKEPSHQLISSSLTRVIFEFIFLAIVITISSLLISMTTDKIAQSMQIGSSWVGAMFLGVATSLPEMISLASLIRLKNYDLAVGNIVGSNLFNFTIIFMMDVCYVSGSIFEIVDTSNMLLVLIGLMESVIISYLLIRKAVDNLVIYSLPSFAIIMIYVYYVVASLNNG